MAWSVNKIMYWFECTRNVIEFLFDFSKTDQIEMALFVLRYVSCLIIFLLGLKAPGIMQNVDYFSLNDSQRNISGQVGNDIFSVSLWFRYHYGVVVVCCLSSVSHIMN